MDISLVYEFCLSWAMAASDKEKREDLKKTFSFPFDDFKNLARKHRWWLTSMEELNKPLQS